MYAATLYVLFIHVCMYEACMVTSYLPVGCNEVGFISTISVDGVTTDAGSNQGLSIGRVSPPVIVFPGSTDSVFN